MILSILYQKIQYPIAFNYQFPRQISYLFFIYRKNGFILLFNLKFIGLILFHHFYH